MSAPTPGRLHGGPVSFEPGPTIPATFLARAAAQPDQPAVRADDGELSYGELAAAAAATAAELSTVEPATKRVALLCTHGATTVAGLLGTLAAGRAYVPLDPSFPVPRLAQLLADSRPDALLVDAAHADLGRSLGVSTVHIGQPGSGFTLVDRSAPDDPAYVLYTSGSTGAPKGVVQSHRNVLFGIANHIRTFAITPADRVSVLSSFGYDMAVTDLFGAILSGATAVPVDVRTHGLGHLARTLAQRRVTVYHSTPTVYRYLLASLGEGGSLPEIRAVLLGGEEVTRHDVALARRHFGPGTVFVNGYGTTEISFATQYHLPPDAPLDEAVVPIGHPLPGIEVILDGAGEIVVRTPHVALGYLDQPELTASRFVEVDGVRAYRTGDLAERLPDGRLVFRGRADRLVKVRGHRVELGEIETALAAQPGVSRAAVVRRPSVANGDIIGYAVPAGDALDPAELRAVLAATLPEYMVPRVVVLLDELPIGPTGKLEAARLPPPPAPGMSAVGGVVGSRDGTGGVVGSRDGMGGVVGSRDGRVDADSGDPTERAIAAVWCEVLDRSTVDHRVTFFDLGGHSLLLGLVQQRLETELGYRLPLARLLEYPTVESLAAHLRNGHGGPSRADQAVDRMHRRRLAREGTP